MNQVSQKIQNRQIFSMQIFSESQESFLENVAIFYERSILDLETTSLKSWVARTSFWYFLFNMKFCIRSYLYQSRRGAASREVLQHESLHDSWKHAEGEHAIAKEICHVNVHLLPPTYRSMNKK